MQNGTAKLVLLAKIMPKILEFDVGVKSNIICSIYVNMLEKKIIKEYNGDNKINAIMLMQILHN